MTDQAVPLWQCDFQPLPAAGVSGLPSTPLNALTVGAPFEMSCHGDIAVSWEKSSPQIQFAKDDDAYTLAILQVQQLDANSAQFIVTAYKPGDHHPDYLRVLTGKAGFESSHPEWKVQTIIKDKASAHPFPPVGPFTLSWPIWIWLVLAAIVAVVAGIVTWWIRRMRYKSRLQLALAEHASSMTALAQFHKNLRRLRRQAERPDKEDWKAEWLDQLALATRVYFLREFDVLTTEMSFERIRGYLKKHHREIYRHASPALEKLMAEMRRFQGQLGVHGTKDFEQLVRMAQNLSEAVEKIQQKKRVQRR